MAGEIVQVLINDDSDRSITGVIVYERAQGGTLVVPAGATFPLTDLVPGEIFYRTDLNSLWRRDDTNTSWVAFQATPSLHAPSHIEGAADALDTDKLALSFAPANYNPTPSPPSSTTSTQLASHLAGIDAALTPPPLFEGLLTDINNNVDVTTSTFNDGVGANDNLFVRTTLNLNLATAGLYRVDLFYTWAHDSGANDFIGQIKIDGAREYFHRQEPKDSAGSSGPTGTDQVHPCQGFILLNLTGGAHTLVFSFGTSKVWASSSIHTSSIMLYKVS